MAALKSSQLFPALQQSTLWPWLSYNNEYGLAGAFMPYDNIHPCIGSTCSEACVNATQLFDGAVNTLTCALWASQWSLDISTGLSILPNANLHFFEALGINVTDTAFAFMIQNLIGDCFQNLYGLARFQSFITSTVPLPCETVSLFELGTAPYCLHDICSPQALRQDVGGIGVFVSFFTQSSIAVLAFFALLCVQLWPRSRINPRTEEEEKQSVQRRKELNDGLVTVMVDFQKSQCYFALAIQIAALVFVSQEFSFMESNGFPRDLVDMGLLFTIATNGFIPIVFSLVCIGRYGRRSWYMIMLSACSVALSTATLVCSDRYWNKVHGNEVQSDSPNFNFISSSYVVDACGGLDSKELLASWCGSDVSLPHPLSNNVIDSGWNWVFWTTSILWLLYCALKKAYDNSAWQRYMDSIAVRSRIAIWLPSGSNSNERTARYRPSRRIRDVIGSLLFAVTWSASFGYQFYLYSLYFNHSEVETEWSFGQIIAISVWAPSLVEFVNLALNGNYRGNEYKLGPTKTVIDRQNTVVDHIAAPSASGAMQEPFSPSWQNSF